MVNVLSNLIAVLITVALALILYPIAAVFWILGFIGQIGGKLFVWTNALIKKLWDDIHASGRQ